MLKDLILVGEVSGKKGTMYIGVINNLAKRILGHKNKVVERFASKYHVNILGAVAVLSSRDLFAGSIKVS
jgi:predicted GIY-YIG superfamily endonuclease